MDSVWRPWYTRRRWQALAVLVSGVCLIALMYQAYATVYTTPDLQSGGWQHVSGYPE